MKKIKFKIILMTILSVACCVGVRRETFAGAGCKNVEVIYARGTGGERFNTDEWRSLNAALKKQLSGSKLSYSAQDLDYPANGLGAATELLGVAFSAGKVGKFADSVELGTRNLKDYQKERLSVCPKTQFLLVGYSQGAKVIAGALDDLDAESVAYVALLGDPGLYLPEGKGGWLSKACLGMANSTYRVYAPNCSTEKGILGARKPYEPSSWKGKIGLWCNDKDLICGSSRNLLVNIGHVLYGDLGHFDRVIEIFCGKLRGMGLGPLLPKTEPAVKLNTVILIDTTGSMWSAINRYKTEALRLARQTLEKGGKIALYEYRDLDDPFEPRQLCDFSCDLEKFSSELDKIDVDGGGDIAESLLSAAMYAMRTLTWTAGANKSLVVLTDAPYLSPDRNGVSQREVVELSLKIDPVNFYVITEEEAKADYAELTMATGGKVFGLDEMEFVTDYIEQRPVALLPYELYAARVGETIRFDASGSYGLGAEIVGFEWDLDNNGDFELSGTEVVQHAFDRPGEYAVVMKVTAENGMFSTMSAKVMIMGDGESGLNLGALNLGMISGAELEYAGLDSLRLSWELFPGGEKYVLISLDDNLVGYVDYMQGELILTDLDLTAKHTVGLALMDEDFDFGEFEYLDWSLMSENKKDVLVKDFVDNELGGVGSGGIRLDGKPVVYSEDAFTGVVLEKSAGEQFKNQATTDVVIDPDVDASVSENKRERRFLGWGLIVLVALAACSVLWILLRGSRRYKKRLLYE